MTKTKGRFVPRVEAVSVRNFRCLADVQLKGLTPLTALLGPNASGKSAILDVFAFLAECFTGGVRLAWERRGRFREFRTYGAEGPVVIEIKYRERQENPGIIYHLAIDEDERGPFIAEEWLRWRRWLRSNPFRMLDCKKGLAKVTQGEMPDEHDPVTEYVMTTVDMPAATVLGQLNGHPRLSALRRFITSWQVATKRFPLTVVGGTAGAGGDGALGSVHSEPLLQSLRFLQTEYPQQLKEVLQSLAERIPGTGCLRAAENMSAAVEQAAALSSGARKLLAHLVSLANPAEPLLLGVDGPEEGLHPRLQPQLAHDFRLLEPQAQCILSTHSPFLINGLAPEEVWSLVCNKEGHTIVKKTIDLPGVREFMNQGAMLGYLWTEGYFESKD